MEASDFIEQIKSYFVQNGIGFEQSSLYDGKICSIETKPISIRAADIVAKRYSWNNDVSVLKIGTEPGKAIINILVAVSHPESKRLTVGSLIEKLSKYDPAIEVVGFNNSNKSDCFITDVVSSEIVEDDMYGNYLDDFHTQDESVCTEEPNGKEFVVLFGE